MSVFTGMGKIVELVYKVFINSYQFIFYFTLWMTTQAVVFMVLGCEIELYEMKPVRGDDGEFTFEEDYTYETLTIFA